MSWWGKLLGGAFGFMLGGPLGALIGAALGHNLDAGLARLRAGDAPSLDHHARRQTAFFAATFSVMGHIAKADGRVSESEIRTAKAIMEHLRLTPEQERVARELFRGGKAPDFPLDAVLEQLRRECHGSRNLLRVFLEIQVEAACADGAVDPREHRILVHLCERLGLPRHELDRAEALRRAHANRARGRVKGNGLSLEDAYAVLGVEERASTDEVKRAYRRLLSQHHPDKLVSRGLPDEMMQIATEKTREIRAAYERVMEARGMR